tara:strand:- start:27618 stop:28049 length:432 start_codon:yes stop_codon:yes gene_type:complete
MPEPIPVAEFIALLNTHWSASNVTKPVLSERNNGTSERIDLNRGDYCIGSPGSPTLDEEPIGNWTYVNRTYTVSIELTTKVSRQRLYDLVAEVRRVCHSKLHNMTNFQRVQFSSFNESVDDALHIWQGTCDIQLTNANIIAET